MRRAPSIHAEALVCPSEKAKLNLQQSAYGEISVETSAQRQHDVRPINCRKMGMNNIVVGTCAHLVRYRADEQQRADRPGDGDNGQDVWLGEQDQRGLELAVADLDEGRRILGQMLEVVIAEDHCDAEQAVSSGAQADRGTAFAVVGHNCSGAAIAASAVSEEAGVTMISATATNPKLTDQGFRHIFRMVARDTLRAGMAAEYLADE